MGWFSLSTMLALGIEPRSPGQAAGEPFHQPLDIIFYKMYYLLKCHNCGNIFCHIQFLKNIHLPGLLKSKTCIALHSCQMQLPG